MQPGEIPDHLRCEQCGTNTVEVVIVSLVRDDTDRLCSLCAMAMFTAIAAGVVANADA
jgi:hypothetical protein